MNRLASLVEDTLSLDAPEQSVSYEHPPRYNLKTATEHEQVARVTFTPMHYEAGYAYPLLVWLHGKAGDEQELREIMPLVSTRNHVAVAPRGTAEFDDDKAGYYWCQSASHIERAEKRVFESIEAAHKKFNIHSRRIFLAGYGCGGTMAVRIAWSHPQKFAGVASIGGPLPQGYQPLGQVNQLRELPMLLCSGLDARHYSQELVCENLKLLHVAGMTAALRQYACGDELRTGMLSDLDSWIMDIVCNNRTAVS